MVVSANRLELLQIADQRTKLTALTRIGRTLDVAAAFDRQDGKLRLGFEMHRLGDHRARRERDGSGECGIVDRHLHQTAGGQGRAATARRGAIRDIDGRLQQNKVFDLTGHGL